jgi:hypothetical protein
VPLKEIERGIKNPGSYGRIRQMRVDTGNHIQVKYVNLKRFIKEIKEAGYQLVDCHYFEKQTTFGRKFTVVTVYSRLPLPNEVQFSVETMRGVRELISLTWKFCHLWKNPAENGKTVWTINLMHIFPNTTTTQLKSLSFKRWLNA